MSYERHLHYVLEAAPSSDCLSFLCDQHRISPRGAQRPVELWLVESEAALGPGISFSQFRPSARPGCSALVALLSREEIQCSYGGNERLADYSHRVTVRH